MRPASSQVNPDLMLKAEDLRRVEGLGLSSTKARSPFHFTFFARFSPVMEDYIPEPSTIPI